MTDIAGIDVARIELRLPESSIRTKAGTTLGNPVTLVNLTPLPDFFYLAVSGIPAPWASFDKESVNLFPNWSDDINLTLAVPAETRPGSYLLVIEATSHTQDNVNTSIRLQVVVEGETSGTLASGPIAAPVNPNGGAPTFQAGQNEANYQPGSPTSFALAPEFPRLQLDLEFGEMVIPCGQNAEQVAHLLNLSANPQNFSVGLEGLPPEWITVLPPVLRLSPNWSEAAHLKIAVPVDAIPGRYLIGVRAVPDINSEAVVWRQFDIVILPPASLIPPPGPFVPDEVAQNLVVHPAVAPQEATPQNDSVPSQPESLPVASQFEATPVNQPLPVAPLVEQLAPQQPAWNQPGTPAVPAYEAPKAEPKQRSGLFGWKKKKAEPVQPAPILFVPIAPAEQTLAQAVAESPALPAIEPVAALPIAEPEVVSLPSPAQEDLPTTQVPLVQGLQTLNPAAPLSEAGIPQLETSQTFAAESVLAPPATTETDPVTPTVSQTGAENPTVEVANAAPEQTDDLEINSPIDEVVTKAPSKFWWDTPAAAPTEKIETGPSGDEAPALTGLDNTAPGNNPEVATALETDPTPAAEGPAFVPASVTTENLELKVENVKIQFELGTNSEQQVSLVNLMSNPAFFDLKIEGLPETWYGFSYSQINLFPNWREQVYLRLEAPTDTTPGVYPATFVVTLSSLPDDKVEVPLEIEVLPSAVLADKLYRATGSGQPVKLPPDARVELMLDKVNLTLTPTQELEQIVSLVNHSPIPDLFELKLEGLLESWYQFSAPRINLFPNWKEDFYLRIALPQNAVPGLYPVRLMVKGQNYSELHTEQSLLLQVLPPLPKPVVPEEPATESGPEINPALGDVETFNPANVGATTAVEQTLVDEPEAVSEEIDSAPAQPFSFASFFQQQHLVPGAVAQSPAPAANPAPTLPVVPDAPEPTYNQPTSAIATPGAVSSSNYAPVPANTAQAANPFEKRPTVKMGQQHVIAPQTSLAGIIPVITAQSEASAVTPAFVPVEEPPMPVVAPRKRTFWQRLTGKGKEPPAPAASRLDENVLWRQTPVQAQGKPAAYPSEPLAAQATQVNRSGAAVGQPTPAAGYAPIGGPSQPAQTGQRSYSPMSTGGEVARVQITLEKPQMTIVAGDSATQQVFLMNLTSLPDNFELNIEGLPGNWFSFENSTVNLFPNWNEHTALTIKISDKVKPDLYKGRLVVTATAQTGIRAIMPIEIQVLAPLVVQARLQPHRGKGYRANYEMLLRNRSMSEGLMTMQWAPSNDFSVGTFTPPQVILAPGQTQQVKLQVMLRKKTPSDQARQAQPFKALVQPQWTVAQVPVVTAPVSVEGEYIHRSRWVFIQRHPVLLTFLTIILVIVLLWNLLILPFIQNTLISLSLDKVTYSDIAAKTLVADQLGFNLRLKQANPLDGVFPTDVSFVEAPDKNPKGVVTIRMQAFVFTATITGTLQVDPVSGDLEFVADNKRQLGSYPWLFIPPDKVVQKLSIKLKAWLKEQNPQQRLDDVYIEGNTVFLKLRNCQAGEVACK
jgi:uncharacterized membrane protein